MAQVKFVIDDELLKKFKQIVIKKHGKLDLTPEGEEAIRLYIKRHEEREERSHGAEDPLITAIGAIRTGRARSALHDLKELEAHP